MIVSDKVLEIWIELIKMTNENVMEKLYRGRVVPKSSIFLSKFRKFRKFSKNDNSIEGGAPAPRVIRAGTRLTVHRSLP